MKFYVAFSVHGTNQFTVATINKPSISYLGAGFTAAESRRPDYDRGRDGIKVHWVGLNRKDGTPIRHPSWVAKRFNQLVRRGWTLQTIRGVAVS